jgi:hypothetical protein
MRRHWPWLALAGILAVAAWFVPETASLPQLGPEWTAGEVRAEVRDAWVIAQKLLGRYGPDGLDRFTDDTPGAFGSAIEAGVLTAEDAQALDRHGFGSFSFRRSPAFSRRYEFGFRYAAGRSESYSLRVDLDHRGEPVRAEGREEDTSADLAADVRAMWAVDPDGRTPPEAIPVASRVFNTPGLVGLSRGQIIERLGEPGSQRPGGRYNFPFWPAGEGDLVYRFDTGMYGWQFNVRFGWGGRCTAVERHWIH